MRTAGRVGSWGTQSRCGPILQQEMLPDHRILPVIAEYHFGELLRQTSRCYAWLVVCLCATR
jgi:hypothetical protein